MVLNLRLCKIAAAVRLKCGLHHKLRKQSMQCCLILSHTCQFLLLLQHQSAASNEPHAPAPSQWNSWPKWSPVAVNSWPKYLWFYLYLHLWITCDYSWLWMSCDYYLWIMKFICIYVLSIYIYIWIACDVYCELSVMFIWMWSWLSPNQINWLFVASLPSVTLGKEAFCRVPAVNHSAK